ncbi:MAG: SpoIIE family protein phosphatase, partial [Verrucomicrobiae bacterium]|nr:SpoIIE family protein phosphatase [Verrucomicrobiae bacterium]
EMLRDMKEANEKMLLLNDRPSAMQGMSFLAYGQLRRRDYASALATVRDIEERMPTHQLKAAWIMEVWPICAQVYLDAVADGQAPSEEARAEYLSHAHKLCKDSLSRGRKYPYIYGWACHVTGKYWWLRGERKRARKYWNRGIAFLRQHPSPYRLASLLREAGKSLLQEKNAARQAQDHLLEAKEIFAKHECPEDAAEVAALLQSTSGDISQRPHEALTFKRHLESLLSVTQAIGSVFQIEDLLEHILSYAMEVTGAERGCILLESGEREGRDLELRVGHGWDSETAQKSFGYESHGVSLALVEQVRASKDSRIASSREQGDIAAELAAYGVRQAMAVPLRTKEKDLGVLYLDNQLADGVFGEEELELMKSFAVQAAVSIENTRLVQSLVEQDRLKQEMRLGQEIQRGFLPKEAPKVAGLNVAAFMQPAREIGGDYYDFILRPGHNGNSPLAVVIGDVTGKGLGAGLNMAMVKTTLLTLSREEIGLREILAKANRILHGQMSFGTFITLLYLQWDPGARAMSFAGAGHCDLLVIRGKRVEVVKSGGAALGLIDEIEGKLQERPLPLERGDKVILYTDGVVEALNSAEEEFGLPRLIGVLEQNAERGPEDLLMAVRAELATFTGDSAPYDDVTLIAIERAE